MDVHVVSQSSRKIDLQANDVKGLKYFKVFEPLLKRLHQTGTQRDNAGNRKLHMDQYCTLILLWLYSPIVDSMRGLQQASKLRKVQKRFGIVKTSLGSLSEFVRCFDPEALKQIARELADQLPTAQNRQIAQGKSNGSDVFEGKSNGSDVFYCDYKRMHRSEGDGFSWRAGSPPLSFGTRPMQAQ